MKKLNLRKLSVAAALLTVFFATPLSQALAWESNGAPVPGQIDLPPVFEKMAAQGGARQPAFMSTHPDPLGRAQALRDYIKLKGYA